MSRFLAAFRAGHAKNAFSPPYGADNPENPENLPSAPAEPQAEGDIRDIRDCRDHTSWKSDFPAEGDGTGRPPTPPPQAGPSSHGRTVVPSPPLAEVVARAVALARAADEAAEALAVEADPDLAEPDPDLEAERRVIAEARAAEADTTPMPEREHRAVVQPEPVPDCPVPCPGPERAETTDPLAQLLQMRRQYDRWTARRWAERGREAKRGRP